MGKCVDDPTQRTPPSLDSYTLRGLRSRLSDPPVTPGTRLPRTVVDIPVCRDPLGSGT